MYSVVSLVAGQAVDSTFYSPGGVTTITSTGPGTAIATECTLLMPDGTNCSYTPWTTPLPHKKCIFPNALTSSRCTFAVDILSRSLSGLYIINSTIANGDFVELRLFNFLLIGKTLHFVYSFLTLSL
jgi:hypothetical protein